MKTHLAPALTCSLSPTRIGAAAAAFMVLTACTGDPKSNPGSEDGGADGGVGTDGGSEEDGGVEEDGGTDTGEDPEVIPGETEPWLREESVAPGSITFSEILYHPADDDGPEWIELHNPMALDMDLSGWSLADGVRYDFPEGTVLAAGGFLVVAADPAGLPDSLGPYDGSLANSGERVELWNNYGRLIDIVAYGDDDPWPVGADGSGLSLAKIDADAASDHAENWTVSVELGGTPGASNLLDPLIPPTTLELVALDATWRYDLSGTYPASDWAGTSYDDGGWEQAAAIFFAGAAVDDVEATAWVTADNYYGLYLGRADGSDLRLVGEDPDGDWTTVDGFDLVVSPQDHLYIAAWEAPWDYGGPQMTIAEVELPDAVVGTAASSFEWVLGPVDGCPGTTPADPPPGEDELVLLIEDAEADGLWDVPAVEADRSADPWGWAISTAFSDVTRSIWVDTFSDTSVTNTDNTYALFRSVDPLLASRGTTELPSIPTTILFRTRFVLDAEPSSTALALSCVLDDGAVVYLNGVELHRENMPTGAVVATTLAAAPVGDSAELYAELPTDSLVRGDNVLAVEVHQAESDDADMRFGCSLTASITAEASEATVVFNELAASSEDPYWVELQDVGPTSHDLTGLVLVSSEGDEWVLPEGSMEPGELWTLDDVGFPVADGDVLFLYSADRTALLDAARVQSQVRARADDGGPWRTPREATPGDDNVIDLVEDVVISEIQYHHAPRSTEGEPVSEDPEEWIELYNRGEETVDLGGWQLVDAVAFEFPEGTVLAADATLVVANDALGLAARYPGINVIGDFSGGLDNKSDRILLLDERGNPADEVRYYDGGRWPSAADGGGSSLELRDPRADNRAAEAWAASDESARSEWTEHRFRSLAAPSVVGPDGVWEELVLGLLDEGTVLIDDLSVIQDPDTEAIELIQNGTFVGDSDHWRLLGNHRLSAVVPDPDDPANPVLRLVATGATGHMHNHAETTLLYPIQAREYEISYRARWISGSNQLNSRLYFNRIPHTALVEQPEGSGTPGALNSTGVENLGPTFADFGQDVAVPAAGQPVGISVSVDDPDGVEEVILWSSVAGAAFEEQVMSEVEPGRWEAIIDGQAAGTIVQFYVEASDGLGSTAAYPAAGDGSRALFKVDDGRAATNGLHNFRIILTAEDSDWLHEDVNLMSDGFVGGTVVYDESQVFYDVGVRLKGSQRGRPQQARLGYGVRFGSDQLFRGSHGSVLLDRSEGVGTGQREVLLNLVMTRAGSVSGEYNDLVQALTPLSEHTGPAELQLDRFSGLVLDAQFEDGGDGALFEYEYIYYPYTTDDGTAEGLKLPQPDDVVGTSITDLGDDKEAYRWVFLVKNNEREDDYDGIIELGSTFASPDFLTEAEAVIDVDQWLRGFAFATLSGAVDNYGGDGSGHNACFYKRPEDGRMLYFPHDLDYFYSSTMSVVGNGDLARLLVNPDHRRAYYGHLQDIIGRAYNLDYLAPWCDQLGELLPSQDFEYNCSFIDERADWLMNGASDSVMALYPAVDFRITTGGGADFTVKAREVTLEGEGWIDIRQISLDGATEALEMSWIDEQTWQATVPLEAGTNELLLVATDLHGATVGTDSVVVTSTGG